MIVSIFLAMYPTQGNIQELKDLKKKRFKHVATKFFKCWKRTSSFCVNEFFVSYPETDKARSYMALRKGNLGQKSISFLGHLFRIN